MGSSRPQSLKRLSSLLTPSDIINLSFVSLILTISIIFADRVPQWRLLVLLYIGMLVTACCLIWAFNGSASAVTAFFRRWYPLGFVIIMFFTLSQIVHYVLPYDIDAELIAFDHAVFGAHPTVFLSRFLNPYFVDVLEICYASFYFLPVILGLSLYFRGRLSEFEELCSVVCLGFYLSYIGNMLFPACGPLHTMTDLHTIPLEGRWVGGYIRTFLLGMEPYQWDCFPSGHTTVTLITLVFCYRFQRRMLWWMLPVGTGLILATVFLRYHYVADIAAGAMLAFAVIVLADAIQRMWQGYFLKRGVERVPSAT